MKQTTVLLRSFKRLYLLLFLSFFSVTLRATTYVLAVGVADYQNLGYDGDLRYTENDIDAISNCYRRKGAKVKVLKGSRANSRNVINAMYEFFSQTSSKDNIILAFSGHGTPEGFCLYDCDGYGRGMLFFDDIKDCFKRSRAKTKVIFADACFSGRIRQGQNYHSHHKLADSNLLLFLSCRSNETSIESSEVRMGYFTKYLVDGLNGKADRNGNGLITAVELFNYVSRNVSRMSDYSQHPVMWGNFDKNCILMKNF